MSNLPNMVVTGLSVKSLDGVTDLGSFARATVTEERGDSKIIAFEYNAAAGKPALTELYRTNPRQNYMFTFTFKGTSYRVIQGAISEHSRQDPTILIGRASEKI
jgi:hypothetical protein